MINQRQQNNFIYWSFLSLFIYTLLFELPYVNVSASNFFILLYFSLGFLLAIYSRNYWNRDIPSSARAVYNLLLFCNLIAIARAIAGANNYYEWKHTFVDADGGISLLIPLAMMSGFHFLNNKRLIRISLIIFKYSFILIPIALSYFNELYARIVTPITIFVLFVPYFKRKERLIILAVAIISAGIAISWRANALHILISLSLLTVYYFRRWITSFYFSFLLLVLFAAPLYFLNQGIKGNSIFAALESDYTLVSNGAEVELTADTRTQLYEEVLTDLNKTGNLWLGKGSVGRYKTEEDYNLLAEIGEERSSIEVGFLRNLVYTGILGFLLYTLTLVLAIYYGIFHTNNTLTKMLSLSLAAHWSMLFIEETTIYSMYYFFTWAIVGLCFSKKIRNFTDGQIKELLQISY